jgi:hypothetical protein
LQYPPKITQIWGFGLKTNHLANLVCWHEQLKPCRATEYEAILSVVACHTVLGRHGARIARFFLVQNTKTGKNIPNYNGLYQVENKPSGNPARCCKYLFK